MVTFHLHNIFIAILFEDHGTLEVHGWIFQYTYIVIYVSDLLSSDLQLDWKTIMLSYDLLNSWS